MGLPFPWFLGMSCVVRRTGPLRMTTIPSELIHNTIGTAKETITEVVITVGDGVKKWSL